MLADGLGEGGTVGDALTDGDALVEGEGLTDGLGLSEDEGLGDAVGLSLEIGEDESVGAGVSAELPENWNKTRLAIIGKLRNSFQKVGIGLDTIPSLLFLRKRCPLNGTCRAKSRSRRISKNRSYDSPPDHVGLGRFDVRNVPVSP